MAEPVEIYTSPHVLEYPYVRSTGPTIGSFLTGLREGKIVGTTGSEGRVIGPPTEYDPITSEDTHGVVEVGPGGTVETWAWVSEPRFDAPLDRPFAWALVKLDGADTSLLHVVDAGTSDAIFSGLRVTATFVPEADRVGAIKDLRCFVPEEAS